MKNRPYLIKIYNSTEYYDEDQYILKESKLKNYFDLILIDIYDDNVYSIFSKQVNNIKDPIIYILIEAHNLVDVSKPTLLIKEDLMLDLLHLLKRILNDKSLFIISLCCNCTLTRYIISFSSKHTLKPENMTHSIFNNKTFLNEIFNNFNPFKLLSIYLFLSYDIVKCSPIIAYNVIKVDFKEELKNLISTEYLLENKFYLFLLKNKVINPNIVANLNQFLSLKEFDYEYDYFTLKKELQKAPYYIYEKYKKHYLSETFPLPLFYHNDMVYTFSLFGL